MNSQAFLVPVAAIIVVAGFVIGGERNSKTTLEGHIVVLDHVGIDMPDFDSASDFFYENTLVFPLFIDSKITMGS